MLLYHYTIGLKLPSIFECGELHRSPKKPPYGLKPIVWLSSNPNYERSALKVGLRGDGTSEILTTEFMQKEGKGIFRFVFDSNDHNFVDWQYIRKNTGISSAERNRLLDRASMIGASESDWYGFVGSNLSIEKAKLEICTGINDDSLSWKEINPENIEIESGGALSMTVSEISKLGYQVNLDEAWNNS